LRPACGWQSDKDLFFYGDAAGAEVDFLFSSRIRTERLSFQAAEALFPGTSPLRRVAAPTGAP
jgi:hypothetical protein